MTTHLKKKKMIRKFTEYKKHEKGRKIQKQPKCVFWGFFILKLKQDKTTMITLGRTNQWHIIPDCLGIDIPVY